MSMRVLPAILVLGTVTAMLGCRAPEPLPQHAWRDVQHALTVIQQRQQQIETLSAEGRLTLRRANGDDVTLDGLLVAQRPDRLRAQAWKFDRKVLDLTARDDGVWLWVSERVEMNEGANEQDDESAGAMPGNISQLGDNWLDALLTIPEPSEANVVQPGNADKPLIVRWQDDTRNDIGGVQLTIDRPTLTVRVLDVLDAAGAPTQRITMQQYRLVNEIPLPTRIHAGSEARSMELRLHGWTVNEALPESVFEPPADAQRRQ